MDDERQSMDMAVEDAHKISFLVGWVAMLEDVEWIGDVAERGTGNQRTRGIAVDMALLSVEARGDPTSLAVTGGRHPSTEITPTRYVLSQARYLGTEIRPRSAPPRSTSEG